MNRINNNRKIKKEKRSKKDYSQKQEKLKRNVERKDWNKVKTQKIANKKQVSKPMNWKQENNNPKKRKNKKNVEKNKEKKKFSLIKFIGKLLLIILILLIILGALFFYKVQENGGGVKGALITILGLSPEEIENLEPINVLLLGVSEDIDTKLTDTIIVCSYNPKNQLASMISIPRDTFIGNNKNKAKGTDKINSLYARGPEKLLKEVSEITGMDLDYYAVVNNNALIEIIDIIGEIDFEVPINMDYDDPTQDLHIHLKKGMQKINGEKAELLLRFRHNNDGTSYPSEYGDNDYGRMKTQRDFITETIKQTLVLENLRKSKQIVYTILNNVETNIDTKDLLPYIPVMVDFDVNTIISKQLPGESEKLNDLWFFVYDKKETKNMVKEIQNEINN